ncbi:MAG: hypothetical protein LBE27_07910, partial [Deltaproteobacteria bacterium]|nr:hypothetical protein [Deltaproteobacteria bacterium]
ASRKPTPLSLDSYSKFLGSRLPIFSPLKGECPKFHDFERGLPEPQGSGEKLFSSLAWVPFEKTK